MKKRALSWLLALTMLLTLAPQTLPVWASATGEKSSTATQTESKLSANTYSALGLSRNVADSEKPKDQPYGKAKVGNTIATNVINELYVNFNGSIHYGWSILDNLTMQYKDGEGIDWTSSDNFYGAMGYWRPNQQPVHYGTGNKKEGALFATNKTAGEHDDHLGKSINSANKHLTYQYSKSEAFSPNTGKDNYVAEMTIDSASQVYLYIYQVEGGNKRYVRSTKVCDASESGGGANDKANIIYNWEYDAMYDIAAGDMDGDGYDEIAVYAENGVYLYSFDGRTLGQLVGTYTVINPSETSSDGRYKKLKTAVVTLAFGDLNADDKDELVIAENIGYGATNIDKGKVGIYRLETNESTKKNTLVKAMQDDISLGIPGSSGIFNNAAPMIRYANVATGDIDGDYQDELIIAGYVSAKMNNAKCNRGDIAYMIVKGNSDNQFKHSDWNAVDTTNNRIDLLDRVVDNENQLIPPVALTCAATQGVGHSEQLFLGGWLYSVGLSADMSVTLSPLTRISTNREYKKDNGDKANKEEIFVVNVVAGNFNGNRNGQEQIVYAFGMKHDDSDRYWYDIGYINKKEPGDTHANESSGYWYGQEQVMNYESSYNRDQNKRRASLYLSLAAVDCDNDSTLMRYKGQEVTWTKPEVLTVLQSAPYFQDLEDTRGYINQGQTGYGKGKGSGSSATAGTSLSIGTYVSFEQDFSVFGVKIASIQAEAQTKHSFNYGYEHNQTVETEVNYSGSAGDDYAVVYAVPYMEYQYETWVPGYKLDDSNYNDYLDTYLAGKLKDWDTIKNNESKRNAEREKAAKELGIYRGMEVKGSWQPCTVSVPMTPRTVMLSVDDYDDIANVTEGLQPIRGNILNSTPGDPTTYDVENSRKDFNKIGTLQTVTKAQGSNISVTQTATTEEEHSFEYDYEFEAKVGAGAGGLTVGVLAGFGANAGGGISKSTSKSYSATVDNLPSDADGYALSWQFGWRKAKLNNNDVLVLEYQQKDTKAKPSPPKNLRVESVTSNSVTLTWDPVTGAGAYKIYQVEKSNNGKLDLFPMEKLAGTATSWTDEGLSSNTNYIYVAQTITQSGEQSITSTQVNASTLEAQGGFKITKQPRQEDATTYAGGTVSFSVEAECRDTNNNLKDLHYQWQVYDKQEKEWKPLSDGENSTYHATVNEQNNGDRYRCRVYRSASLYLYSTEVTLKIDRAASLTAWASTPNDTVKSTYFITKEEEVRDEKGNLIYADVPEVVDGRTKYSYQSGNQTQYVYVATTGSAGEEVYHYYPSSNDATEITQVEQEVLTFGDESYNITRGTSGTVPAGKKYTVAAGTGDVTSSVEYVPTEVYNLTLDGQKVDLYHYFNDDTTDPEEFWFVEVTEGGQLKQYVAEVEKVKKLQIDTSTLIDISSLAVFTTKSTDPATTTVQKKQAGDTVKLTVNVADANTGNNKIPTGSVTFKVVNTTGDGGFTKDVEIKDGKAEISWNPTTSGVYTVTAIYSGSDTFKESQSDSYTINVVTPGEKKLVVSGENMTYGESQTLKATLFDGDSAENISAQTVNATYTVSYNGGTAAALEGSTFTPDKAGTYTITASYKPTGSTTAITSTKVITVNRKTVTVVPKVVQDANGNLTTDYDILDGTTKLDKSIIPSAKIKVTCGAVTSDGKKPGAGVYPITVTYTSDDLTNAKYLVVCDNSKTYEIKDDVVYVTNATTNSNGKVNLSYTYKDQTYAVNGDGGSGNIPKGAKLTATAQPNVGYRVEKWLVDNKIVYMTDGHTPNTANTITVKEPTDTDVTVEAAFTQIYYPVNFGFQTAGDGTITAKYVNDNGGTGTVFNSGSQLSPLQKIQLTAKPENGQVISGWQIKTGNDVKTVTNKDGTNYTGNTYTLSAISGETEVTVLTESSTEYPVTVKLVDEKGDPLGTANATVSFDPTSEKTAESEGTYTYHGQKHQDLTISLNIQDSLIVDSWTAGEGQTMPGTLSANKKKLTISNLQGDAGKLDLTVKCVTPNSYPVTVTKTGEGDIGIYKNLESTALTLDSSSSVQVRQASSLRVVLKPTSGWQVLNVLVNDEPVTLENVIDNLENKAFTIDSVDGATNIKVTFVKKPVVRFSVTPEGETAHGTVTANGMEFSGGTVPYGYKNDIVFTAKPEPGYEVDSWTVTGVDNPKGTPVANSDNQTYTYTPNAETGITSDLTVTVSFKALPKATVEFSVVDTNGTDEGGTNGTLTATAERKGMANYNTAYLNFKSGDIVYAGSTVTFTATPNTGYRVQEWKVNGAVQQDNGLNITANTLTLSNITEAKNVTVQFMQVGSKVTAAAGSNGSITSGKVADKDVEYTGGFTLAENAQATFTAQPDTGYEVDQWLVNGSNAQSGGTTFNYTAASGNTGAAITVIFRQIEYQVKWTAEHGTVTVSGHTGESATIRGGEELSFTASPADGYTLIDWKVNGERQNSHATSFQWTVPNGAAMSSAVSTFVIEPVFSRGTYAVTITKPDHASITANKQNLSAVTGGEEVTFTAAPEDGYILIGWTVNGTTTNTRALTHKVEVNEVTTVTAVIVPSHYAITYQADNSANGTVSVEGHTENPVSVAYGENITFKAEPKNYYHVAGWKVDDTMQPNSANKDTFTLENVTKTQTVTAVFGEAVRYTVSYQVEGGNGSLSAKAGEENLTLNPDQTTPVLGGTKLVFTAAPNNGYMVKEWKIDSNTVEGNLSNKLEIGSLEKKTIVTVSFEPLKLHTITANGTECEIKDVIRTPSDYGDDTHVRDRGTVSFKVVPTKASMGLQGLPENAKVVYNSDGSYTVTVTNVTSDISFQMKEYQAKTGNLQIPSEYTESTLKSALRKQIHSSVSGSDIAYLDIKLQIKTGPGENDWEEVTSDNFPQGGIDITIPYSALGQSGLDSSYNYSVAHMLENGTVENLSAKGGTSGVTFHVNSLSPFAIGWYKNTPTPGGGGGGGGAVSTYTLTFDTNGGSAIDKITKDSGTTIDLAAYKPTRTGYTFAGWFSDKALTKAVTSVKLTANTTVYAKWTQNGGTAQNPFVDVKEGAYYYDAVLWAVEQKITSGTSATTFSPDASCTRAQMVTFLWRAAGSPKVENGKNPFADVKADAYYYDAVLWAVEKGVTSGTSATTFSPDATVTRGQTVTFLYRNAGSPEVSGTMPFTDVEADAYYAKAVQWAVQQKITTGTSETTFSPMSDCTRGQIVTFLYRAK